jgi:MFS family permease
VHSLNLLYLGYGVLGGCGMGMGYITPVAALVKWFPERRGLMTGVAVCGYGAGALVSSGARRSPHRVARQLPVDRAPNISRILVSQFGGQRLVRKALIAHRA